MLVKKTGTECLQFFNVLNVHVCVFLPNIWVQKKQAQNCLPMLLYFIKLCLIMSLDFSDNEPYELFKQQFSTKDRHYST